MLQVHSPATFAPALDWITLATFNWNSYAQSVAYIRRTWPVGWRHARWLQYQGWRNADGIFYGSAVQTGEREHFIMRVSGGFTQPFIDDLLTTHLADGWYCTRLDVQMTRDIPDWWDVRANHDNLQDLGFFVSMIQSDSGSTLYVGSRKSDRFIRFYEKDLSGPMLRLEFELKGRYSRLAYQLLLDGANATDIYAQNLSRQPSSSCIAGPRSMTGR